MEGIKSYGLRWVTRTFKMLVPTALLFGVINVLTGTRGSTTLLGTRYYSESLLREVRRWFR